MGHAARVGIELGLGLGLSFESEEVAALRSPWQVGDHMLLGVQPLPATDSVINNGSYCISSLRFTCTKEQVHRLHCRGRHEVNKEPVVIGLEQAPVG